MKFCTKCGAQNIDEAQICNKCQSYLVVTNNNYSRKISKKTLINIFGITNGIVAFVLGIITFFSSSLPADTKYIMEKEIGEEAEQLIDIILCPAKAFSVGIGSLLIVIGIFLVLYFINKLI